MGVLSLFGAFALVAAIVAVSTTLDRLVDRRRNAGLRQLACGLTLGNAVIEGALERRRVRGKLDGHDVEVRFEERGSGEQARHVVLVDAVVRSPAASFEVAEASLLGRIGRSLGVLGDPLGASDLVLVEGQGLARRLIQADAVQAALRRVLRLPGVTWVRLRDSTLRIELDLPLAFRTARRLREALEALVALARLCDRVPVQVRVAAAEPAVRLVPGFAWTAGGAEPRCPYCRDALEPEGDAVEACGTCRTAHHAACLAEAGGCTVLGCRGRGLRERGAERGPAGR